MLGLRLPVAGPARCFSAARDANMRVDKFLQVSGIIPRRSQAQEACTRGYVHVNDRRAKPSTTVSVGGRLSVRLGRRLSVYEVVSLPSRPVPKKSRHEAARLLHSERLDDGL